MNGASMRIHLQIIFLLFLVAATGRGNDPRTLSPRLRRPTDAIWLDDGKTLLTCNSRSGSVSIIDVAQREVVREFDFGGAPVAVHDLGLGRIAMLDHSRNSLKLLRISNDPWSISVVGDIPVLRGPLSLLRLPAPMSEEATPSDAPPVLVVSVASLWDRSIQKIEFEWTETGPRVIRMLRIQLPFAPREQLELPGSQKLLVADNHAGQLAIIDLASWTTEAIRQLNAHNIRGLELSENRTEVLISHQILNQQVPTGIDAVRDGILMQNVVRVVPLEKLLDSRSLLPVHARTIFLGRVGEGASDPADLAWDLKGTLCVALSGVDELALLTSQGVEGPRPSVGKRPTKLLAATDRPEVLSINTLGDSVSIVNTETGTRVGEISLGPWPELTPRDRGEILFFDGRLSLENWMSCHSCHTDGHANGMLADTFGDGSTGAPKRVLTLLGGRDANPWGWTGTVRILHEQVTKSVRNTMHGKQLPMQQVIDLVAYMHALDAAPPLFPESEEPEDIELLTHGRAVFEKAGCVRCHVPPLTYTTDGVFDVGIHDEAGRKEFNPPSLRGVSQRDSLFHDARAKCLDDVLDQGHYLQSPISDEEQRALLRFLNSL